MESMVSLRFALVNFIALAQIGFVVVVVSKWEILLFLVILKLFLVIHVSGCVYLCAREMCFDQHSFGRKGIYYIDDALMIGHGIQTPLGFMVCVVSGLERVGSCTFARKSRYRPMGS